MKFKKIFLLICLLICLFSMASVCASETNDTAMASEDTCLKLSADNEMDADNLQTNDETPTLAVGDNDETLSAKTNSEIITEGQYTYSDLREQIGTGGNKNLTKGTYTYNQNDGDAIVITDSGVIDGNGAVIDMAGSTIRAFDVIVNGVTFKNLTIINTNFWDNGGAIKFAGDSGAVINCNFINNTAQNGGAIYFDKTGTVINCNFTDNKATGEYSFGGAVYFKDKGTVTNCNFNGNQATGEHSSGGAVYFWNTGNVTNCNFNDNSARSLGGAVCFLGSGGTVTNCNFTDNSAYYDGGAVYFDYSSTVTNCNLVNNSATYGGAVYFDYSGTVTNCNFTGNNATTGSAIYFYKYYSEDTLSISNSIFLNNRANAQALEVTENDNNITITFKGQNNLLNAIYSRNDAEVTFTNVTYWSATGIAKTGSTATTPSRSNKAAGQNITVSGLVNDNFVSDIVYVTDENGAIVLNIGTGDNYYISVRHDTDSYYTEAEKTISNNIKFNVNVTSQTTNNWTVNITAKSNIPNDIIGGRLLFILPHNIEINATYVADGIWWAEYTFDNYGNYQISASYIGHDNVSISNATISISKADSTISLDVPVLEYGNSVRLAVNTTGALGITAELYDGQILAVMGNMIILPDDLKAGPHALIITTLPDADHIEIKKTVPIYIEKAKTQLAASAVTATYNINKELVISLTDSQGRQIKGATVSVDLNGTKDYTTDSNGQITLSTQGLTPKIYTVNIAFEGNNNYNRSDATTTVTIIKDSTNLVAEAVTATYNVNKELVITLTDSRGNPVKGGDVTVDLNGVKTFTTDANGQVKVATANLAPKAYTAKITFNGNGNYLKSTKDVKVTVKKATPKLVAKKKTFKKSKKVKKYTVTLKANSKALAKVKLTLKVKGKTYKAKTNSKGKAVFKIKKLTKKGTYKAKVKFAGNTYYNAVTKTVKIKIK